MATPRSPHTLGVSSQYPRPAAFLEHLELQIAQVYLTALSDDDVQERTRRTSPANN